MSKAARHRGEGGSVIESRRPPILPNPACGSDQSTVCGRFIQNGLKCGLGMHLSDSQWWQICSSGCRTPPCCQVKGGISSGWMLMEVLL